MVNTQGITRGQFLTGALAFGAAGALLPPRQAMARPHTTNGRPGLRHHGVVYTVGEGETPATAWNPRRMRADLRAVRDELHADTVDVTGDGVDRLTATAAQAAELGLHSWLQPTLADVPERDILEHLAETGRFAERLRRRGASVDFSVGCEFWLFVPGIVPGATVLDRVQSLLDGTFDPVKMQRKLDAFTKKAAALGRSVFHGNLSYAAAQDDKVDWNLFDIVGIDYYSYFRQPDDHVRKLHRYQRWGKPVTITEFGTCAYKGAEKTAGMGWNVVDYDKNTEEIRGHLIRSEHTQAAYVVDLLEVFESMDLYGAMAFEFVTPDAPHRVGSPRFDLDMASYAITKTIKDRPYDPSSPWHWEPKEAFRALARRYARACRT